MQGSFLQLGTLSNALLRSSKGVAVPDTIMFCGVKAERHSRFSVERPRGKRPGFTHLLGAVAASCEGLEESLLLLELGTSALQPRDLDQ